MNMDKIFWENYYKENKIPFQPSPFAKSVLESLEKNSTLIDIGCGNGRDSIYFSNNKIHTFGVDQSKNSIENLKQYENKFLKFKRIDISELDDDEFEYGYCRFLFHSINEQDEKKLLVWLKKNIKNQIFIESRIDIDKDKYKDTDHYRRLMNIELFKEKLKNLNFKIESENISSTFSFYDTSYNVKDIIFNPNLVRFVLRP